MDIRMRINRAYALALVRNITHEASSKGEVGKLITTLTSLLHSKTPTAMSLDSILPELKDHLNGIGLESVVSTAFFIYNILTEEDLANNTGISVSNDVLYRDFFLGSTRSDAISVAQYSEKTQSKLDDIDYNEILNKKVGEFGRFFFLSSAFFERDAVTKFIEYINSDVMAYCLGDSNE